MPTIYKYRIPFDKIGAVEMPKGAKILLLSSMFDAMYVHALVEPESPTETRFFRIFGTGDHLEHNGSMVHVGSLTMPKDRLVFHVFEDRANLL